LTIGLRGKLSPVEAMKVVVMRVVVMKVVVMKVVVLKLVVLKVVVLKVVVMKERYRGTPTKKIRKPVGFVFRIQIKIN
jgi:hypothetical protein